MGATPAVFSISSRHINPLPLVFLCMIPKDSYSLVPFFRKLPKHSDPGIDRLLNVVDLIFVQVTVLSNEHEVLSYRHRVIHRMGKTEAAGLVFVFPERHHI